MKLILALIYASLIQTCFGITKMYPEQSKQIISSTVETPCFLNSAFEPNKFVYLIPSITNDAENSNSFTLTGWFRSIGNQLDTDGKSILFYISKNAQSTTNSDLIFYFGIDQASKSWILFFYGQTEITVQIQNYQDIQRTQWHFLSVSFQMKTKLNVMMKQLSNGSTKISNTQQLLSSPNIDFLFSNPSSMMQSALIMSSQPMFLSPYNPSCVQMKNVQVHWNYIFNDFSDDDYGFLEQLGSKFSARLQYYFTMELQDLFNQDNQQYLRNRSYQEGNHLIIDNSQAVPGQSFIEFQKPKILPSIHVNDGFMISYWINLSQIQSGIVVSNVMLGDNQTQLQITHVQSSGNWQVKINSYIFSHAQLGSNWHFFLFVFDGSQFQSSQTITLYSLNASYNIDKQPQTNIAELKSLMQLGYENIKVTIGSTTNQSNIKMRDFKVFKGVAIFQYGFEGFSSNCQLVYGLETKYCLLCTQGYSMNDDGICTKSCVLSTSNQELKADYITSNFSKCLPCSSGQSQIISPYDNQCREILGIFNQQYTVVGTNSNQDILNSVNVQNLEYLVVISSQISSSLTVSADISVKNQIKINSSTNINFLVYTFNRYDKISSGVQQVVQNQIQYIQFTVLFSVPPKVIVSLIGFNFNANPQIILKKVSTEGFYIQYNQPVTISWLAISNCLEVLSNLQDASSTYKLYQNSFGQIQYHIDQQIYVLNQINTVSSITIPPSSSSSIYGQNKFIQINNLNQITNFAGYDIALFFKVSQQSQQCKQNPINIPFSQINALFSQIQTISQLQPNFGWNIIRFRTPKPTTDFQILFTLLNFSKSSQYFTYQLYPRYIQYSYSQAIQGSNTDSTLINQSDYYYFTIRLPSIIVTQIYTVSLSTNTQQYTFQLQNSLPNFNVQILGSIINWTGTQSITLGTYSNIQLNSFQYTITINSADNGKYLQIQFMIITDSFSFRQQSVKTKITQSTSSVIVQEGTIFGVSKIPGGSFQLNIQNNQITIPTGVGLWVLDNVTMDTARQDSCNIIRNEDFKCDQCQNQLLYGNSKNKICTCPPGFGFDSINKKCVRCSVGCLYCVFDDNSTTSQCQQCDSDSNFTLSQNSCVCNPNIYQDDKDSNFCIPTIDQGNPLSQAVINIPVGQPTKISSIATLTTNMVSTQSQMTLGCWIKLSPTTSSPFISFLKSTDGTNIISVSYLSNLIVINSDLTGITPAQNFQIDPSLNAYLSNTITNKQYLYIGISLDTTQASAYIAIYIPNYDYWIYYDNTILPVLITTFTDSQILFSDSSISESTFILGTTISAQKQSFLYHVRRQNSPLYFYSVADAGFDITKQRYTIQQNQNIIFYYPGQYQYLLPSSNPYLQFPDTMKDQILTINYEILGYGVKADQQLNPSSLQPISTNFVISFWVRGQALLKQDEDIVLAQVNNFIVLGHYLSNGLVFQVVVCISFECQTVKKWYVDNNQWNQLSFVVENTNDYLNRKGTLVRAFYKTLQEKIYFESTPDTSTQNVVLGSSINSKQNQGFWYNFFTLLDGNFYKYKNVDDTVSVRYCTLNAGKYYNYCLKCSYQNPRTDHVCSQLPTDASCTSPENLSQITQAFPSPAYTYQGRDPYMYYQNYDVCERCVTPRCSQCQTTIDNCIQQCSNQCQKCALNQPWTCNKCRGNRTTEPSCSTCPSNTADDYVSENCQCSNSCGVCQSGSTSCGCNSQVDMCNSCADSSYRSYVPLCQCQFGYYDSGNAVCEKCDPKCTRCQNTPTNCIQCQGNRINPPNCSCPDYTYDDGTSICKNCPTDCVQCAKKPNSTALTCIQCRFNSSWNGQACVCNQGFYDNQQVDNCTECDMLCKTCERAGQCTSCIGKRVLNSNGQCICPDGFFGKIYQEQCEACYQSCRTCFGKGDDQCIECYQDPYVRLRKGRCICANGDFFFNLGLKQCTLYTTFTDYLYYDVDIMPVLSLNFTNSLNSTAQNVMDNMVYDIEGLTYNQDFTASIFYQNQGNIEIKFNLLVSFRPTTLKVTVKNADAILDANLTPLNRKYFGYTMLFKLYPHHNVGKDRLNYLMNMRKFSHSVYDREGFGIDFVWLLQLLAAQNFIFSAMQPTSMILMYNQYLPINVYETLRAFSILQYQQCPVWGEFGYEDTMIFRKSSESITHTQIPDVNMRRFGYSSSFFINMLRQIFLYGFLWFVFYLVKLRFLNEKYTQIKNKKIPWLETFYSFFLYFMSKFTEAFFITLTIVVFMQIQDPSFSNAFNGISYLLNFIYMGAIGGVFYFFFDQMRNHDILEIEQKYIACHSLGNLLIDIDLSNNVFIKYYHMITYIKKLFYSIIIIFATNLKENHTIPLIIIEAIFLIYFIIVRPLSRPLYNIIRALINTLYIGILVLVLMLGRKWVSITKDQVIIDPSDADSFYSQGTVLLILILVYNLVNFIFNSYVAALHFYHDYIQYKNERIKEEAFDNLYNKKLFNYQELQEFEINQERDSIMKIIDLDDKRNVGNLPIKEIESEIVKNIPVSDEEMLMMQVENNNKRKDGFYHIILRKDIISRNYIDPINKSFTIAVETVETFGAKRQSNPILNNIETNIVVDYSNTQRIIYKSGQEEFRVLSDLLSKWKIQKRIKVQRELSCMIDLSKYKFGDTIDITTPQKRVDYFIQNSKSKSIF
ncbi:hypothetical protein ABPG74_013130 [Tetrahymena malaccensis]